MEPIDRYRRNDAPSGNALAISCDDLGNCTTLGSGVASTVPNDNELHGYKNPKWRSQVSSGQDATTPMWGMHFLDDYRPWEIQVNYDWIYPPSGRVASGYSKYYLPPITTNPTDMSFPYETADNQALSKFHDKINSAFRSIMSGESIGEMRETVSMIRHRGSTLYKGQFSYLSKVMKLRKGRLAARLLRDAADLWLEFMYGWKPLVHDIEDAIRALNAIPAPSAHIRAVATVNETVVNEKFSYSSIGGVYADFRRHDSRSSKVIYRGKVSIGNEDQWQVKNVGFAPSDFLPTVYELIPWSFLIDYFSNLQSIVNAVSNLSVRVDWWNRTVRREKIRKYSFVRAYGTNFGSSATTICKIVSPGATLFKARRVDRSPGTTGLPFPALVLSLPTSPVVWANISALAAAHETTLNWVRKL